MSDDPCKVLRETYDKCFQIWLDTEYFQGKVRGPVVPCKKDLNIYHNCLKTDPKRANYLSNLEACKKQFS